MGQSETLPRTRPLTLEEQSDLIEAAYYAMPEIEDAAERAEGNTSANNLLALLERVTRTAGRPRS